MIQGPPEPRFDRDYAYGRQADSLVGDYLDGLAAGRLRLEVKRKRLPDSTLYVERGHDPGRRGSYRDSGLTATEADLWAWVPADTGVVILTPVDLLQSAVAANVGRTVEMSRGSCPTHGQLITLDGLLRHASHGRLV